MNTFITIVIVSVTVAISVFIAGTILDIKRENRHLKEEIVRLNNNYQEKLKNIVHIKAWYVDETLKIKQVLLTERNTWTSQVTYTVRGEEGQCNYALELRISLDEIDYEALYKNWRWCFLFETEELAIEHTLKTIQVKARHEQDKKSVQDAVVEGLQKRMEELQAKFENK